MERTGGEGGDQPLAPVAGLRPETLVETEHALRGVPVRGRRHPLSALDQLPPSYSSCQACPLLIAWRHLGGLSGELERLGGLLADETEAALLRRTIQPAALPALPPGWNDLAPREREVARWLREGASDAEIAATLHIRWSTARGYASSVLRKLGARSRYELRHLLPPGIAGSI